MGRIFCDVDDTLVLYQDAQVGPHPYGLYMGTPFAVNTRLVAGLIQFRAANLWELIVIWSGGGKEYAEMWARRLGLDRISVGLSKDVTTFDLIQEGDVVVDDEDLGGRRTHRPDEWPEEGAGLVRIAEEWAR